MITRFAPTPSGYLHEGNAANALLVAWLAEELGGQVALRIDDLDAARLRPAYVDDIFDMLHWLGIDWSVGPRSAAVVSQRAGADRLQPYRDALHTASDAGLALYACTCSRRMLTGPATGGCPGGCLHEGRDFVAGETVVRAHIPSGTSVEVAGTTIDLSRTAGDVVLWRRDDLPAYHLASVVDDSALGVTHIVRGEDLRESTALQVHLAPFLGAPAIAAAVYLHHGLVTGPDGAKLSKSQLGSGAPLPRTDAHRAHIERVATELGAPLGITPR